MARERKGAVVERFTHPKTKREGTIRLDKSSMTFFARVPDEDETLENAKTRQYFESQTGRDVRDWLSKQLAKQEKVKLLTWLPVIEVEISEKEERWYRNTKEKEQRSVSIKVELDRYYIALSNDQTQWLKLSWWACDPTSPHHLAPEDRLVQASEFRKGPKHKSEYRFERDKPFKLPALEGNTSFVPYTEELWRGLTEVADRLEQSRTVLADLLTTKKGLATLADVGRGQLRLGSGSLAPEDTTV